MCCVLCRGGPEARRDKAFLARVMRDSLARETPRPSARRYADAGIFTCRSLGCARTK